MNKFIAALRGNKDPLSTALGFVVAYQVVHHVSLDQALDWVDHLKNAQMLCQSLWDYSWALLIACMGVSAGKGGQA